MGAREELAAIRERAGRATTGPWKIWGMAVMADPKNTSNVDDGINVAFTQMVDIDGAPRTFDAQFIAHARRDVPRLLDLADALVHELDGIDYEDGLNADAVQRLQWAIEAALTTDTKGDAR